MFRTRGWLRDCTDVYDSATYNSNNTCRDICTFAIFTTRIRSMGEVMFSLVSVCVSVHTPAGQAMYAAGGMPLAVSHEDFLVIVVLLVVVTW